MTIEECSIQIICGNFRGALRHCYEKVMNDIMQTGYDDKKIVRNMFERVERIISNKQVGLLSAKIPLFENIKTLYETDNEKLAFLEGVKYGFVLSEDKLDLLFKARKPKINVSKLIIQDYEGLENMKIEYKKNGLETNWEKWEKMFVKIYPNDILRQVRRSIKAKNKISTKDVNRFFLVIKEIKNIPYIENIADLMNKTEEEILEIYKLAKKQKKHIDIVKQNGKQYFLI